jgi:hypothetical protein
MHYPSCLIVLICSYLSLCLNGQSIATLQVTLLNETTNQPIKTNMLWHSLKTNKDIVFKTDDKGFTVVKIEDDQRYEVTIPKSSAVFTVEIPDFPDYQKALTLRFPIDEADTPAPKQLPLSITPSPSPKIVYQNLIGLQIINKPQPLECKIIDTETKAIVKSFSSDTTTFILPLNNRFNLSINNITIENPNFLISTASPVMLPYILHFESDKTAKIHALNDRVAINLTYLDLNNQYVKGDTIFLKSQKTGQVFKQTTFVNGSVLFLVPKDDVYEVSLKYFNNIYQFNISKSRPQDILTLNYTVNYPTATDFENRAKEYERMIAERDSLYKIFEKEMIEKGKIAYDSLVKESKRRRQRYGVLRPNTDTILPKLAQDPHYFEKQNDLVNSVLYRHRDVWKKQVIVTDVTGSMFPYLNQLALWLALELTKGEKNGYLFFNDGDDKPNIEKKIGKTGGIYKTQNMNVDSVIELLNEAMWNGHGGDVPENNIEALIAAEKILPQNAELIMVADALAPIKDLILWSKLTRPVRIILCGSKGFEKTHPDYLWLAYKTKGSLHTVENDISLLGEAVEGKTVKIKGRVFRVLDNAFYEIK